MKLHDIYNSNKPVISFEVFPPKTDEGIDKLLIELKVLRKYSPGLVSVTYGAGGTTQGRSLKLLDRMIHDLQLPTMPHLTCIGSSPESIKKFMTVLRDWGVENILALRGDVPKNNPDYKHESDYFQHAKDLVEFAKTNFPLDVAVAGFPEVHPEALSPEKDLEYLSQKVSAGASTIFTQLFFDNRDYFKFVESVRKLGITQKIIPGIWTITSLSQIPKISNELCKAKIPEKLLRQLNEAKDEVAIRSIGIEYAVGQIKELLAYGVPGIHLYTLNKSDAVSEVIDKAF